MRASRVEPVGAVAGVNDRADVLAELCRRLVDLRVMPYYLHQLDPVAGAAHFEVPDRDRRRLDGRASRPAARLRRAALRPRDAGRGTSKEVLA